MFLHTLINTGRNEWDNCCLLRFWFTSELLLLFRGNRRMSGATQNSMISEWIRRFLHHHMPFSSVYYLETFLSLSLSHSVLVSVPYLTRLLWVNVQNRLASMSFSFIWKRHGTETRDSRLRSARKIRFPCPSGLGTNSGAERVDSYRRVKRDGIPMSLDV